MKPIKRCSTCSGMFLEQDVVVMKRYKETVYYRCKKCIRANHIKSTYGVTQEWYDEQLSKQQGGCAICGTTDTGYHPNFHVDHCHATGNVRGLLCSNCNTSLGKFKDDKEILQKAIDYLEKCS